MTDGQVINRSVWFEDKYMNLEFRAFAGRFVSLEPFAPAVKAEVRALSIAIQTLWAIMPINPTGDEATSRETH